MNIVFVNYDGYSGCSGVHTHFLANALVELGHRCTVILPVEANDNDYFGKVNYQILLIEEALLLAEKKPRFYEDAIFHAWTPRERVRTIVEHFCALLQRPYFVHLEDNEEHILECAYQAPFAALAEAVGQGRVEPAPQFSHPVKYREFLAKAVGVTCIIDALRRFVPQAVPSEVFWPACEEAFFRLPREPLPQVRAQLGIGPEETVITYPGNFHFANYHVMRELYLALDLLAESGHKVRLIRTGGEYGQTGADAAQAFARHGIHVGQVSATEMPALVGAANLLVQPGAPGAFDDCRFPSKLPMFLASARPLITAPTNLGQHLIDGEHCLILEDSSAQAIAAKVRLLMDDKALARTLGDNGRAFARSHFSWERSARRVEKFYARNLGLPRGH